MAKMLSNYFEHTTTTYIHLVEEEVCTERNFLPNNNVRNPD